jgi:threonine aldolase
MSSIESRPLGPRWFASDNNAGAHPKVLEAIQRVNSGHAIGYGDDPYTRSAAETVAGRFGPEARAFFVFTGTGANVLALDSLLSSHNAVVCSAVAHINTDECGAPERFTGSKLLPSDHEDGKLSPDVVDRALAGRGDQHRVQPAVLSLSQATELGTVYSLEEMRALTSAAHARRLRVHIDGARLSNAAACLGVSLAELTTDVGVDVVCLGGTKNGLLFGEAVVFLDPRLSEEFEFRRKQGMQLASKMRFVAAQFQAMYSGDLWLENASHANSMARRLAAAVGNIEGVEITRPVQTNAVFAGLPAPAARVLQKSWPFYFWDEETGEVRWMASWDTTEEDVDRFAEAIARAAGS